MMAVSTAPMGSSGLVWRQLVLPVPVDQSRVQGFFAAVATMPGDPLVVCEAVGSGGSVRWRIGAQPGAVRSVQALALAHLPGVRLARPALASLERDSGERLFRDDLGTAGSVAVAVLRYRRCGPSTLRGEVAESVTRSVLAVLASARAHETIRLQLVLGPRQRPQAPVTTTGTAGSGGVDRRQAEAVLREHGFRAVLRVSASTRCRDRSRALVWAVAAALRNLEAPHTGLQVWRSSVRALITARLPWLAEMELRPSQIAAVVGWPLCLGLPGVASAHPRVLPVPAAVASTPSAGGVRVLGRGADDPARLVALAPEASLRHLHLLGPTGVGKSTLMAHLALQDASAGHGVVIIDPMGDLVRIIAARLPAPLLRRTVVLDATDACPVGINPLVGGRDPDLAADLLLGVFRSLYADSWGPRTQDILHACLLTLARRGDASLLMVPLLLTHPGFRRSVTGRMVRQDPLGLGSFWSWFEALSDGERHQAIAPLMNKLRPILLRPQLRAVLGQRAPRFTWNEVLATSTDPQKAKPPIVLVSLAKGVLGQEASALLGSVIVTLIWQAALERVRAPRAHRHPVMLHIDEVQDYLRLPGDLSTALAQARGLGLGLTLSHQHLGQLPRALLSGIMANALSRVAFALPRDDARAIASLSGGLLEAEDYQQLPAYSAYASLLAGGRSQPPLSLRTLPLAPPLRDPQHAWQASRQHYGQPLGDIEVDLARLAQAPGPNNAGPTVLEADQGLDIGRVRPSPQTTSPGGQS